MKRVLINYNIKFQFDKVRSNQNIRLGSQFILQSLGGKERKEEKLLGT